MIGALTGTVFAKLKSPIILMVGGVGYSIRVTDRLLSQLKIGEKLTLFIQTYVREDTLALFGFISQEELDLFEMLQTVSGIGPRTAMAVIDRGVNGIKSAITTSDVDFFTSIPRLGKKNAQKIIIELKSKLGSVQDLDLTGKTSGETKEILDALTSMEFTRKEALEVIKRIDNSLPLAEKIRQALKLLGRP